MMQKESVTIGIGAADDAERVMESACRAAY